MARLVLGLALNAVLTALSAACSAQALIHAHAHNDYVHARPLLGAVERGFCSVEADVWLVDGQVLVAHDRQDCDPARTLRALYLEPLRQRVEEQGGRVHRDGPLEFQLLIDFKSGGRATWEAVRAELEAFAPLFTRFGPEGRKPGPVLAVLSGGAPDEVVLAEETRLCAVDGWFGDVEKGLGPDEVPLLSASWLDHFQWTGHGAMPADQRARLLELTARAHAAGRRIRFWAVPNRLRLWEEQLACGVDWLNLDNLPSAERFLRGRLEDAQLAAELEDLLDRRYATELDIEAAAARFSERGIDAGTLERALRTPRSNVEDLGVPTGRIVPRIPLGCEHVDYETTFLLYLPPTFDPSIEHPLLIVGHGGNGAMPADYAERAALGGLRPWCQVAAEQQMVLAAPLTERGWGAIGNSIVTSLVSKLRRAYRIDPDRVFLTGHSMGGHLTWRSALTMPDRFAAVAPMSGGYDYVERGVMPLLWNVPGYGTFGAREPYEIDVFNRRMRTWFGERPGYDWTLVEKPGGHEIFADEIPRAAAFFADRPRDLYRKDIWAQGGRTFAWTDPGSNPKWGRDHSWDLERPLPHGSFHAVQLLPHLDLADGARQEARVRFGDDNRIEVETRNVPRLALHLHPRLIDFGKPVQIVANGVEVFAGRVEPDLADMLRLAIRFDDPDRVFWKTLQVEIPGDGDPTPPQHP